MRLRLVRALLLLVLGPAAACSKRDPSWLELPGAEPRSGDRAPRDTAPRRRLDLNRATLSELEGLPDIGPVRARSILAARNARGGRFDRLEQLLSIDGIGAVTLERLRPHVYIKAR